MDGATEIESGGKRPQSKVIECGELRVVFYWRGDRFGHRVEKQGNGEWSAIIESVEGSPDADWPPSPVLQSLHIEDRDRGQVALLIGTAGKSHWSASVEADPAHGRLVFDVACRVSELQQWLGSSYRAIADGYQPIDMAALPNESIIEDPSGGKASQWRIRPVDFPADLPHTVRWRYAISLVS